MNQSMIKEMLDEREEVERQMNLLEDRWEAINSRIDQLKGDEL